MMRSAAHGFARERSAPPRSTRVAIALASVLCAVTFAASCGHRARPGVPPRNLLLVTIDDLRPDHLSCYGYMRPTSATLFPDDQSNGSLRASVDALSASGVLFTNAFAPSGSTLASLATLLTGRGPIETGVADDRTPIAEAVPTLAEILGASGFATAACISPGRLPRHALPRRGFDVFEIGGDDEETIAHALQWMQRDLGNDRPFFLWLHLAGPDPSAKPARASEPPLRYADPAYRGPADGSAQYFARIAKAELAPQSADVRHAVDLYDERVAHTLALLGDFLVKCFDYESSDVEATECWSRTVLVLTSPHGIELFDDDALDGARRTKTAIALSDALLHVPLVLRHPDSLTGERIFADTVELQDVLPTLLEWFAIAPPEGVRGRSLLARTDAAARTKFERRPAIASIGEKLFSARTERWRLIWSPYAAKDPASVAAAESSGALLFDHADDRWERDDVARENPEIVRDLEEEIRAWRRSQSAPATRVSAPSR